MPVFENTGPDIRSMKGLHVYYYFPSNCARRVSPAPAKPRPVPQSP